MPRRSTVFVSTDPNNNVPIGVPGQGIAIGPLGRLIYGRGPDAIANSAMLLDMTNLSIDLTNQNLKLE